MSRPIRFVLPLLLLTAAAGFFPLHAKLEWLTPDQEQVILSALPPSPAPGSSQDQRDLAGVLAAQASRTPAQTARVLSEKHSSPKLFQTVLGPHFYDPGDEPKIYHLLYDTAQEASAFDHDAKDHWQRPRPAVAHPDVVHPVYAESGLAYPSGHATGAYACALILAQIYPEKKKVLIERADEIAHDRVIGGVHYPSDIVVGEQLGRAVAAALLANPAFQRELPAAKEEARKLAAK